MNLDRRGFLIASVTAAQTAFAQTSGERIRTAMIGTGNRGSSVLKGILEQPNAKVVALCDKNPDRLDKAASSAAKDIPATYTDWQKVLDRKDVDAIFIATPPHLHSEMAIAALKAGKHVYCEKPIGVSAEQVRDLVKAAKASNKVFMAGQQLRSHKGLNEAIAKIHQGIIGDVIGVKAQRHATADIDHSGSSAEWYFDVTKSGGYLIEQSVHNVDACNWAVGAHPVRAIGFGTTMRYKNQPAGRTIYDNGSMVFEYPSGAELSFTQNVFHPRGMPNNGQYIYVYGTKGAVDLMYSTNMYPLEGGDGTPTPLAAKYEDAPHAHTTAFYDCITKGAKSPADIIVGATGALTAILGHQAMVRRKVVEWTDLGVEL
jgi:myo-inositol 2-dehydrogenase/D-chiro-inositol 1-dehydrogenase